MALVDASWRVYPAIGLAAVGAWLAARGLWFGTAGRPGLLRQGRDAFAWIRAFQFAVAGLALVGIAAAWIWRQPWLLVVSLGVLGEEMLETSRILTALTNAPAPSSVRARARIQSSAEPDADPNFGGFPELPAPKRSGKPKLASRCAFSMDVGEGQSLTGRAVGGALSCISASSDSGSTCSGNVSGIDRGSCRASGSAQLARTPPSRPAARPSAPSATAPRPARARRRSRPRAALRTIRSRLGIHRVAHPCSHDLAGRLTRRETLPSIFVGHLFVGRWWVVLGRCDGETRCGSPRMSPPVSAGKGFARARVSGRMHAAQ